MLKMFADGALKADAPVIEGDEQPSGTVIKMLAGTERRPSGDLVHLRISEVGFGHLRGKLVWGRAIVCDWVNAEGVRRKTGRGADT